MGLGSGCNSPAYTTQGGKNNRYCHLTNLPSTGLLKLVVTQLGETSRRGKERVYEQILERAARAEGALLPVFDEAHLLDGDALTDLRLLISSALDVRPPLKMLLVGQEPLRAVLRRARHADLLNRVSVRCQPRPISREQTSRYIDFQLGQAGGDAKVFDDSVKAAIHDFPLVPKLQLGNQGASLSGELNSCESSYQSFENGRTTRPFLVSAGRGSPTARVRCGGGWLRGP